MTTVMNGHAITQNGVLDPVSAQALKEKSSDGIAQLDVRAL